MGRRRGRFGSRWGAVAVLALVLAVSVGAGFPSSGYTTGAVGRQSGTDVVRDAGGALELNRTAELQEGQTGCLVVVTNRLGTQTTVNVSLAERSRDLGSLQVSLVDSLLQGDSVEFSLGRGESQTVKMDADSNTSGSTVYYRVNASAPGLQAAALNRSAPIVTSASDQC